MFEGKLIISSVLDTKNSDRSVWPVSPRYLYGWPPARSPARLDSVNQQTEFRSFPLQIFYLDSQFPILVFILSKVRLESRENQH